MASLLPPEPLAGNRDFQRLWAAQSASSIGARLSHTLFPTLAVLLFAADAFALSLLALLPLLAQTLTGLGLGGLVDRRSRRRLMVGADLGRALLVAAVPLGLWLGWLGIEGLWAAAFLMAGLTTLFAMADNGLLPTLVSADDLPRANARLEATDSIAEIAGPAAAGWLMALIGPAWTLIAETAAYLWSAWMLGRIRRGEAPVMQEASEEISWREDLRGAGRALAADRTVAVLALAGVFGGFGGGFFAVLYMPFVLRDLGLGLEIAGPVIGLGGIGALLGSLLAPRLLARAGRWSLSLVALIGFGGWLLVPGAGLVDRWTGVALLGLHQVVSDAALVALAITAVTLRQQRLDSGILGRVQGLLMAAQGAAMVAGILVAGSFATLWGNGPALWVGLGSACVVPLMLALFLQKDAARQ